MLKIKKTHRFIFSALIFLLILASVYVRRKNASPIRNGELIRLPDFVATDITGNEIKSADLKGKYLFVQFVNQLNKGDIELSKKVYSNWKDENLFFIAIIKNYEEFKLKLGMDLRKITILNKDYELLASLFNAPKYGTFYLFDPSGSLIYTEGNDTQYEQALKITLNQLIKNKYLLIEDFILEKRNIKNIDWFKQISEVVEKENKDFFVISLFTSICAGCTSGSNFQYLKDFHSKNQEFAYVLCILSDKYKENDIFNDLQLMQAVEVLKSLKILKGGGF